MISPRSYHRYYSPDCDFPWCLKKHEGVHWILKEAAFVFLVGSILALFSCASLPASTLVFEYHVGVDGNVNDQTVLYETQRLLNNALGCEAVSFAPTADNRVRFVGDDTVTLFPCPAKEEGFCWGYATRSPDGVSYIQLLSTEPGQKVYAQERFLSLREVMVKVALHEFGHAFGLGHVPEWEAIMNPTNLTWSNAALKEFALQLRAIGVCRD